MGTITKLLVFYGHGRSIFGDVLDRADARLRGQFVTSLCERMAARGSDKGLHRHNYTVLYHTLFEHFLPDGPRRLFELGVGTNHGDTPSNMGTGGVPGASLRAWRDYFPAADVVGADIDRRVLFQEDGIQTLYVDQRDPASVWSLWEHAPGPYQVILDDGLHEFDANQTFLQGSRPQLDRDGLYIIEDIVMDPDNVLAFDRMLNRSEMSGFLYRLPHPENDYDNAVAVLCGGRFQPPTERITP